MQTIDVRTIVPRERHPLIFSTFNNLGPGCQFKAEIGEGFQWQYLEQGPEVWKVRIGRSS